MMAKRVYIPRGIMAMVVGLALLGFEATVSAQSCETSVVDFQCQGGNDYCRGLASCPPGTVVVDVVAACNLEFGTISSALLDTVPMGMIEVIRPSDFNSVEKSWCYAEGTGLRFGIDEIRGRFGLGSLKFGCKEHDQNGGECHIRGRLFCR